MAKEFKDYDKQFRAFAGKILEQDLREADAWFITNWKYGTRLWSNKEIREAVYKSDTAEEWQKFRVSLKSQTTQLKLLRLEHRLLKAFKMPSAVDMNHELCRIDNYIGALRRGGQLNSSMEIVK